VLAVTRYRVAGPDAADFLHRAREALAALAGRPGWCGGTVGRATDDPELWVVTSEWGDVGTYRRALGDHEVKMRAVPLLALALDEPTAFEVLGRVDASEGRPGAPTGRSGRAADAATVGVGEAAAPAVPSDLD
jgi:hypothetical protein